LDGILDGINKIGKAGRILDMRDMNYMRKAGEMFGWD
jgi:hypothetical protein